MTYIERAYRAPFHKTDPPSRVQQASVASANKRGTREPKPASTLAAATLRTPLRDGLCSRGRRTRASGGLCKQSCAEFADRFKNHYDMINTSLASILDVGFFAGPEQHLTRIWKKIRGWSLELLRMPFTNLLVNLNDCSKPCST